MNFTIEQDKGATIFRPKEARLDSLISSELKAEFLILAQPDVEKLIIDLSEVEYIDSGGLSALLLARRQMVDNDGDVRLVGVRPEVQSLLSLTQLDRVFPSYATIAEALAAPQLSLVSVPPSGLPSMPKLEKVGAMATGATALAGIMAADVIDDDPLYDDEDEDDDDDLLDVEEYEGDEDELDDDDEDDDDDTVEAEPVVVEDEDEYVEDVDEDEDDDDDDDL